MTTGPIRNESLSDKAAADRLRNTPNLSSSTTGSIGNRGVTNSNIGGVGQSHGEKVAEDRLRNTPNVGESKTGLGSNSSVRIPLNRASSASGMNNIRGPDRKNPFASPEAMANKWEIERDSTHPKGWRSTESSRLDSVTDLLNHSGRHRSQGLNLHHPETHHNVMNHLQNK